jgi:hypothetical protein
VNFFGGIRSRPHIALFVEGGRADPNGVSEAGVNRLTVGAGNGTVKFCGGTVARYVDVVARHGSRRRVPAERCMGFSDDFDRRARRSNGTEPNRE